MEEAVGLQLAVAAKLDQSGKTVGDVDRVAHLLEPGQSPPKRPKTVLGQHHWYMGAAKSEFR